jgi:hypothetical protein
MRTVSVRLRITSQLNSRSKCWLKIELLTRGQPGGVVGPELVAVHERLGTKKEAELI